MIGWQHAHGSAAPTSELQLTNGTPLSVEGAPLARNAAVLEAGFDMILGPRNVLSFSYVGQLPEDAHDHGLKANVSLAF